MQMKDKGLEGAEMKVHLEIEMGPVPEMEVGKECVIIADSQDIL